MNDEYVIKQVKYYKKQFLKTIKSKKGYSQTDILAMTCALADLVTGNLQILFVQKVISEDYVKGMTEDIYREVTNPDVTDEEIIKSLGKTVH